jgi:hypothetical protein
LTAAPNVTTAAPVPPAADDAVVATVDPVLFDATELVVVLARALNVSTSVITTRTTSTSNQILIVFSGAEGAELAARTHDLQWDAAQRAATGVLSFSAPVQPPPTTQAEDFPTAVVAVGAGVCGALMIAVLGIFIRNSRLRARSGKESAKLLQDGPIGGNYV